MTGLQAFSEPEQIDIDLLAIPGFSSTAAVNALIDVCQNKRMDALAIIDPPFGFTVEEIVAWQNGVHTLNSTRFDSDFAALYWPWVKIRDTTNRIDVWVPPSGCVIATYVRSDDLGAPWMAPAGMTRGIVPNILDVYSKPNLEERDLMYGYRNAVNPIISFPGIEGFLIWGQKTLQRRPTALDRVNVRRLMFYLEKRVRQESRNLLFEPHNQELRRQFVSISSRILSQVKVLRGLNDYIVKCDEELNTVDVIDRNEMRARIGVQPTRAAEFIYVEFSIHRTGTFSENADTF
jgi:phage tail sheath protein FI